MKVIKVQFTDFWHGFNKTDNFFYNLLSKYYSLSISNEPEILFYSCYGTDYLKYKCVRIFYTAENVRPDFTACDFALSFDFITRKNHLRLPLYWLYIDERKSLEFLLKARTRDEMKQVWEEKKKFCCMVVSNSGAQLRIDFFKRLLLKRHVDSGGKVLNNVGGPIGDKLKFIKDYKFVMAFENSSYPGYTTEKILEPLLMGCIPIYWGNPMIGLDFNPKRFINYNDFHSEDELIEELIQLENNIEKALDILTAPIFTENNFADFNKNLIVFFSGIVDKYKVITPRANSFYKYLHYTKRKSKKATNLFAKMIGKLN